MGFPCVANEDAGIARLSRFNHGERLMMARSGLPLSWNLGCKDLWLPLLKAGKNDCFAAVADGGGGRRVHGLGANAVIEAPRDVRRVVLIVTLRQ